MQIVEIRQKTKGWRCFLCTTFSPHQWVHKTSVSLYFWTNFNYLHTILTRIISQFPFFIQNPNLTTAAWLALFSKYKTKTGSWLVNLCRISKIPSFLKNCLTILNLFSKSKLDYHIWNGYDFSELDCVYTMDYSLGGEKVVLQWPTTNGPSSDLT